MYCSCEFLLIAHFLINDWFVTATHLNILCLCFNPKFLKLIRTVWCIHNALLCPIWKHSLPVTRTIYIEIILFLATLIMLFLAILTKSKFDFTPLKIDWELQHHPFETILFLVILSKSKFDFTHLKINGELQTTLTLVLPIVNIVIPTSSYIYIYIYMTRKWSEHVPKRSLK